MPTAARHRPAPTGAAASRTVARARTYLRARDRNTGKLTMNGTMRHAAGTSLIVVARAPGATIGST